MKQFYKTVTLYCLLLTSIVNGSQDRADKSSGSSDSWVWWGTKVVGATAAGAGAVAVAPLVLGAVGFTSAGIAAGSAAAALQATMAGNVAAGGAFATLQSAGAGGLGVAAKMLVGTVGAAFGYKGAEKAEEAAK